MGKRFIYEGGDTLMLDNGAVLRISLFDDVDEISRDILSKLVELERLVFGDGAFGEYLICSSRADRGDCGRVVSRKFALEFTESDLCPTCNAEMEMVFPEQAHLDYLRWIFNHGVKAVLLADSEDGVVGFSFMFEGDLARCFEEINYRKGYNFSDVKDAVERYLERDASDQKFVCANRIGFHPDYQNFGLLPLILRLNAGQFGDVFDLPALGDTMIHPSGKLFAPVFACGYENLTFSDGSLMIDEHGGVLLAINQFRRFVENLELDDANFVSRCGERLSHARSLQHKLANFLPSPNERFYRHAPVLRMFDKSRRFQFFNSDNLNPRLLHAVADAFREIFANEFGQYLIDPDGVGISPKDIFNLDYVPLEILDSFDRNNQNSEGDLSGLEWWHDPSVTYDILSRKLSVDGNLALLFEGASILGFCFGYVSDFESAFKDFEEWENPYLYSGINFGAWRDIDNVVLALRQVIPEFCRESRVYILNAVGFKPSARGAGNLPRLLSLFFSRMPNYSEELPLILETKFGSKAYNVFVRAGAVPIVGALNSGDNLVEGDIVMMVGDLSVFKNSFVLSEG